MASRRSDDNHDDGGDEDGGDDGGDADDGGGDDKNYASHHSDVVEHEIPTTLLLRGQFVAVIKCVTVVRVRNQLSLECFVGM